LAYDLPIVLMNQTERDFAFNTRNGFNAIDPKHVAAMKEDRFSPTVSIVIYESEMLIRKETVNMPIQQELGRALNPINIFCMPIDLAA